MTVVTAFERLISEGYLEGKVGAGTFVTADLAHQFEDTVPQKTQPTGEEKSEIILSRCGALVAKSRSYSAPQLPTAFVVNQPAHDLFPFATWSRLSGRRHRQPGIDMLNYGHRLGYPPLRRAIAAYLRDARGIQCDEG